LVPYCDSLVYRNTRPVLNFSKLELSFSQNLNNVKSSVAITIKRTLYRLILNFLFFFLYVFFLCSHLFDSNCVGFVPIISESRFNLLLSPPPSTIRPPILRKYLSQTNPPEDPHFCFHLINFCKDFYLKQRMAEKFNNRAN
jgi:hypothetical protein